MPSSTSRRAVLDCIHDKHVSSVGDLGGGNIKESLK